MSTAMATPAAAIPVVAVVPETDQVEDIFRRHVPVEADCAVEVTPVTEHSNLNFVYRLSYGSGSAYVKVVPEKPKRLPMKLPRERVFAEADAMRLFAAHAGGAVAVPEVLFVDDRDFALGMTDVGQGREVLLGVVATRYSLLARQAGSLGRALGAVHSGTAGMAQFRTEAQDHLLRAVVFDGLIAPGARAVFPAVADSMLAEMRKRRECLVHADLWGKNILVGEDTKPAVVDFEGAFLGDPAFDLATVLAVSMLPAMYRPELRAAARVFAENFVDSYRRIHSSREKADEDAVRAFWYTGALAAARGFGPFAYPMPEEVRARLAKVAKALAEQPPASTSDYGSAVMSASQLGA